MVIHVDHIMTPKTVTHIMFLTVPTQCRYLLFLYRGLHSQSRMHPMTCVPNTSSVRVFGCQALLHPYLNHPRRARMYVTHERQHCHKTSHSEVSITHEKKCHPQGASVLERDSATVRSLLLLLLLCRKGKRGSLRETAQHFPHHPTRGMLLLSMEMILSPALHHRTSPT